MGNNFFPRIKYGSLSEDSLLAFICSFKALIKLVTSTMNSADSHRAQLYDLLRVPDYWMKAPTVFAFKGNGFS